MENIDMKELDEFLQQSDKANFMQSPNWASVKNDWKKEIIIVRNEKNEIKGAMILLLRKLPIVDRYIMYAPRGFTCDIYDKKVIKELTNKAKDVADKYKAFIFRLDPDVLNEDEKFRKIIEELGYKTKRNIKDITDVIQPKYVFRLDLRNKTEDEVIKSFESKTRYNARLAVKKGIEIRSGTKEDLKIFYNIMKETGKRDNFFIRPIEYFEKIYDEMGEENVKLLISSYEGEYLSTIFLIKYGNKVWFLYGGSTDKHRNLIPSHCIE